LRYLDSLCSRCHPFLGDPVLRLRLIILSSRDEVTVQEGRRAFQLRGRQIQLSLQLVQLGAGLGHRLLGLLHSGALLHQLSLCLSDLLCGGVHFGAQGSRSTCASWARAVLSACSACVRRASATSRFSVAALDPP
jgi:hypothetical protein